MRHLFQPSKTVIAVFKAFAGYLLIQSLVFAQTNNYSAGVGALGNITTG